VVTQAKLLLTVSPILYTNNGTTDVIQQSEVLLQLSLGKNKQTKNKQKTKKKQKKNHPQIVNGHTKVQVMSR